MTPTSLILVADRGSLKAYTVNQTPTRGASLQLTQAFDITDAHGRYDDKVTDEAGRFPVSDGSAARHANSSAERTAFETETDRRICKQLAEQIEEVVRRVGAMAGRLPRLLPFMPLSSICFRTRSATASWNM